MKDCEAKSSNSVYSDSIPVDLLIEIFLRVPSKSIARFRCVSKFWGSILRRPDFIELFQARGPRILFTLEVNKELLFFSATQLSKPEENSCVVATRYNKSFPQYVPDNVTMQCGLVLRQGYKRVRYGRRKVRVICNPATGEFLTLPEVLLKDKAVLPKVKVKIEGFCIGYDPINKQFKVLCVTSSNTHQVLTLESGKLLWREIESEFSFMKDCRIRGEIYIDGAMYFGCFFQRSYGIARFDVRSEKFSLINIDKDIVKKGPYTSGSTTLINYQGKLGVVESDSYLWVLEDAKNHKWSNHIHIPKYVPIVLERRSYITEMTSTGENRMTSTGEMVLMPRSLSNPFVVFYYDFERRTFARVNIRGFEEFSHGRIRINGFMDYGENMKLLKLFK